MDTFKNANSEFSAFFLMFSPNLKSGRHISSKYYGWGHNFFYRTAFRAVAIPVPDSLSNSYHCTFCLVLFLLKLSLFTNVNYCLVQKPGIYFWYRSNYMSSETQGNGGRGLGRQQLNGLINLYLIKQNLNKFSKVFVKQMVY